MAVVITTRNPVRPYLHAQDFLLNNLIKPIAYYEVKFRSKSV